MAKRGRPKKQTTTPKKEVIEEKQEEVNEMQEEQQEELQDENLEEVNNNEEEVNESVSEQPQTDSESVGEGTFSDYNPFNESVVEREYATPKIASGVVEDINEPQFVPPTYEDMLNNGDAEQETPMEETGNPFDNPNPALNDLDTKDKKIACESLVDTFLDGYEQLHRYAQYVVKVDEDELLQLHQADKIDLQERIPVDESGNEMSVSEFVQQYNKQSTEAIQYDKEFGYKVRPAMVRVFMKKGWGMSDEQFLLYHFGKDIAIKVGIMFQLKKTINTTLEALQKSHKQNKRGNDPIQSQDFEMDESVYDDDNYEDDNYDDNVEVMEAEENEPIQAEPTPLQPLTPEQDFEDMTQNYNQNLDVDIPERKKPTILPKEVRDEIQKPKRNRKKKKDE